MGTSARNIVLLGDQMQLGQPIQGVHPGRSGDSSLDYLLDGAATIAPDRGIFLATTLAHAPGRLPLHLRRGLRRPAASPRPGNVRRTLVLDGRRAPAAARRRASCTRRSSTAAARSAAKRKPHWSREIFASALGQRYTDRDGVEHPMTLDNILVVAPYNMQVNLLKRMLPAGARVGTVDKFQGQEAELVIVSMTTSSEQDLPRHIEFLYSKNRLNVAISRAKCLAIVIANPALMAIKCSTPRADGAGEYAVLAG